MNLIGRIMLKILSCVYLFMAIIGFLGYFQIGEFSTNIFSFFFQVLGFYSIILPVICIVFAVICWKISTNRHDKDDESHMNANIKRNTKLENTKNNPNLKKQKLNTQIFRTPMNINNSFSSYFANELSIKSENLLDFSKDYSHFGVDFPTYFGSGKKNIYLPQKVICLQGFKEYFSNDKGLRVSDNKILDYTKAENMKTKSVEQRHYYPQKTAVTIQNNYQALMKENTEKQVNSVFNNFKNKPPQNANLTYGLSEINYDYPKNEYYLEYKTVYHNNDSIIDDKKLDKLFQQAAQLVISNGIVSTSFLQKRLKIGYSLAARLMDMLEKKKIISEHKNNKPRTILMNMDEFNNKFKI